MSIVVRSPSWRAARSWLVAAAVVALLLAALAGPAVASADDGHDGSTWLDVAVTAQTSDPTSVTVFSAVWTNHEGNGPDYIRVAVDGVASDMAPTSDASFRDGRPYAWSARLSPGDHSIVFSAGGRDRFTTEVVWGTLTVPEPVDPGASDPGSGTGDGGSGDSAGGGSTGSGTGSGGDAAGSGGSGPGGDTTGDASDSGGTGDATGTGSGDASGSGDTGGSGAGDGAAGDGSGSTGDGSGASGTGDGSGSDAGGSTGDGSGTGASGDGSDTGGTGSGGGGTGTGTGAGGSTGSGHGSGTGHGSGSSDGRHQAVDATSTGASGGGSPSTRGNQPSSGTAAGTSGDRSPDTRPAGWSGPDDPPATGPLGSVTDPTTPPTGPDAGSTAGGDAGAREGPGGGPAAAPDGLAVLGLGQGFAERNLTAVPVALTTTGVVVVWAAFMMFGKKRRDEGPPAPDAVLSVHAAAVAEMPVAALVPPPLTSGVDPSEAALPRWRRPSLLEARKNDPLRSTSTAVSLTFANGAVEAVDGKERRRIRYRLVRLMDVPDEFRANEIGILDEGDEVQILETSGIYRLVLCPDGGQGWLHKMVLGEIVGDGGDEPVELVPGGIDEDILSAYLAHRQKTA